MSADPRTWGLARYLFGSLGTFAVVVFVPFFAVTMVVALVVDRLATLDGSVWEAATLVVRLYALVMASYVVNTQFPLFIAHGGTRQEYFKQIAAFLVGHSGLLAVLVTAGFWLESLLGDLFGWSTPVASYTFVDTATDFGSILVTFAVIMVIWSTVAAWGAATVYRNRQAGAIAVLVGLVVVLSTESGLGGGFRFLGFLTRLVDYQPATLPVAAAGGTAIAVICLIVAWLVIRTMPVRNPQQ